MPYKKVLMSLKSHQYTWLITGAAGFIGSHLAEALIKLNQKVIAIDNLATGYFSNIEEISENFNDSEKRNFTYIEGDLLDKNLLKRAFQGVDIVLHQAALGSVQGSIADPQSTHANNVEGFLNTIIEAKNNSDKVFMQTIIEAKNNSVRNFVYASSSAVYGDAGDLPKVENKIGSCMSPYALSKLVNEMYADVIFKNYSFSSIGLRYFNIFGKRQDPNGSYAAVIPRWISEIIGNRQISIFGDGSTTRDFCYIENVIQMNILAGLSTLQKNMIFNVGVGSQTSLNELFNYLKLSLEKYSGIQYTKEPNFKNFRDGEVLHSVADIKLAKKHLGYLPTHNLQEGLKESIDWYYKKLK